MSVKDVTNLRKDKKYKEALDLAKKEIEEDSNEWTRTSLFWSLRDFIKNVLIPENKIDDVPSMLKQMEQLLTEISDDSSYAKNAYVSLMKYAVPEASTIHNLSELSKNDSATAYKEFTNKFGRCGKDINKTFHEDYGWIIYRYLSKNENDITSIDVRKILFDYISLENERPSLLHTSILNFALKYAKTHLDFNFYSFFKLWGVKNLRHDDFEKTYFNDKEHLPFINRIINTLIELNFIIDDDTIKAISSNANSNLSVSKIKELIRNAYFWRIMNHHKEGAINELWKDFDSYIENYSSEEPSYWNSEILEKALRFMSENDSWRFMPFLKKWDINNFRKEDWSNNKGDDGVEYPSLVSKCGKQCFETVKAKLIHNNDLQSDIEWLLNFFKIIVKNTDDVWHKRDLAIIYTWNKQTDEAINLYKDIILELSDKYYIWHELSELITDDNYLKLGLLLKARSIERNEDFLEKIHLQLAECLINANAFKAAQKELGTYAKHRVNNNRNLSQAYKDLCSSIPDVDKGSFIDFEECTSNAENFVYSDIELKKYLIVDKWVKDNIEKCNLYDGNGTNIQIKSKRFPILKKAILGEVFGIRVYTKEESTHQAIIPLTCTKTNDERWSLLPLKYGIIDFINHEKSTIHIINTDSETVFFKYKELRLEENDFVCYREYIHEHNGKEIKSAFSIRKSKAEDVLSLMSNKICVVDDVNNEKQLFHIVFGRRQISDIVKFSDTPLRPNVGDFLNVTYCIKDTKFGKKRIKFLDIKKSEDTCEGLTDVIHGHLSVKYKDETYFDNDEKGYPDFAFIDDFYVHHDILKKFDIKEDCEVKAKIVLGGDDKWKVYYLEIV